MISMVDQLKPVKEQSQLDTELQDYLKRVEEIVSRYTSGCHTFIEKTASSYHYRLLETGVKQEFAERISGTLRSFIGTPDAAALEKELKGLSKDL